MSKASERSTVQSKTKELTLEDMTKGELIQVIRQMGFAKPTPRLLARIRRTRLMDEAKKEAQEALAIMDSARNQQEWMAANERCSRAQNRWQKLIDEMG